MTIVNFAEKPSLISQYMMELRDINVQKDMLRFRTNLERVGQIMAYEISRTLNYKKVEVTTPLAKAMCDVVETPVVLGTIFRAGMPFHQGFLKFFDHAENAFVSAYRKYKEKDTFDIHIEYLASPLLEGKTLILADPMLATGGSSSAAIELVKKRGGKKISLVCLIAAPEGIDTVHANHPDVNIFCAALDSHLNNNGYIVPGLGDAGDRLFGTK